MSRTATLFLVFLLVATSSASQAEISTSELPDMGNLAAMLGKADKNAVEKSVYDKQGKISANLPASDAARGETAAVMAQQLSGGSEDMKHKMKVAILAERTAFEKFLSDANFKTDDMGVAYAACFITLWELASNKELPADGALAAGKFLVHSFKGIEQQYATLDSAEKAKAYDWLMTTPVAFASLVKSFERDGREKEAKMLRERSASLFAETFKLPHDMLKISDAGEFSVDADKIISYQEKNNLSGGW